MKKIIKRRRPFKEASDKQFFTDGEHAGYHGAAHHAAAVEFQRLAIIRATPEPWTFEHCVGRSGAAQDFYSIIDSGGDHGPHASFGAPTPDRKSLIRRIIDSFANSALTLWDEVKEKSYFSPRLR
jgi:hypothetical protein